MTCDPKDFDFSFIPKQRGMLAICKACGFTTYLYKAEYEDGILKRTINSEIIKCEYLLEHSCEYVLLRNII